MKLSKRIRLAVASAAVLTFAVSGVASAWVLTAKTIDTEAGSCTAAGGPNCNSAAKYGPNGFSGTLTFSEPQTNTILDYICVRVGSGAFTTFGGTYHLSIYDGATLLGSATYVVTAGQACTGTTKYAETGAGASITVPASKVVQYTVSIEGITAGASAQAAFAGFSSLRNDAFGARWDVARSYVVPPPTNFIIPEAPFAVLLPLSAGLLAAAYVMMRRPRNAVVTTA
jgi:hypothetical protein